MSNYLGFNRSRLLPWALALGLIHPSQAAPPNDSVDSIVTIYAKTSKNTSSQGTGFFISSSGRILTAYHVVQDAIEIEVFDKNMRSLKGVRIERLDARRDLAILSAKPETEGTGLKFASAAKSPGVTPIAVIGSPRGLPNQVLVGQTTSSDFVDSPRVARSPGPR